MKLTFLLLAITSLNLYGQSQLNKPASNLEFAKILNSDKTTARLSDYKPKILILNFWGTWCAPCIESLPHLEELQNKFKNDLTILTITDESEERINRFLKKRTLSLPVVIDTERKLATTFPHRIISHTVVVDKNGIVKAVTTPKQLNEEIITQLIADQPVHLPEKIDAIDFDPSKPLSANENFSYQITVTPYQGGVPSMSTVTGGTGAYKGRRILCTNLSPKSLFEIAWQYPVSIRTDIEVKNKSELGWSEQTAVCFDLIVPEEIGTNRFEIMKQHLAFLYPYKAVTEKRSKKCKVLKPIPGQRMALKPSTGENPEYSYSGRGLFVKNKDTRAICDFLEAMLDMPVEDDTKLTGLYDLELAWSNEDPKQIHEELKKIGLQLTDETRAIDVLVIYDE